MSEVIPKISVIVPVYKAEAYLHRCVDSLLAQTFQNFEILLIDDGSPDRSGEICDEYARKESRVRVFHKVNGGVSSARQYGMDHAQGEYTIHADPDDWVEPTMLEELYQKAKEEDADMVICDFYEESKRKTIYLRQQPTSLDSRVVLCNLFQQLHGSCCNKLVKRSCNSENDIRFPNGLNFCEDLYINTCLLAESIKKVAYLPKAFYHYDRTININSLVNQRGEYTLEQVKKFRGLLQQKLSPKVYEHIYPYILYSQALLILGCERKVLKTFRVDFQGIRHVRAMASIPVKRKVLVWVAFHISPSLASSLYKIWLILIH